MDFKDVRKLVEEKYKIQVNNIIKRKNVYKIECANQNYCLKVINYEFAHFSFILAAINHLRKRGFISTPEIIKSIDDKQYIEFDDKYAYMTPWILAREADYDNKLDVKLTANKLKELHEYSKGFVIDENMKPRIYWGNWINVFETRILEILDFKKNIERKMKKTDFDTVFLGAIETEIKRARSAIQTLKLANYYAYTEKKCATLEFCHHDIAHHNVLIDNKGNVNIIDFDYCVLDTHIHDLASLCMRVMRNKKWNLETFDEIILSYDEKYLSSQELLLIAGFLEFPQDFWQVGLQYYWERLEWEENRFYGRLSNYINDRESRGKFIQLLKEKGRASYEKRKFNREVFE